MKCSSWRGLDLSPCAKRCQLTRPIPYKLSPQFTLARLRDVTSRMTSEVRHVTSERRASPFGSVSAIIELDSDMEAKLSATNMDVRDNCKDFCGNVFNPLRGVLNPAQNFATFGTVSGEVHSRTYRQLLRTKLNGHPVTSGHQSNRRGGSERRGSLWRMWKPDFRSLLQRLVPVVHAKEGEQVRDTRSTAKLYMPAGENGWGRD